MKVAFSLASLCLLFLVTEVLAQSAVGFDSKNAELTVPLVDVDGVAGVYQSVVFKQDGKGWTLQRATRGIELPGIQSIEVIKTTGMPVQVLLKIKGEGTCIDVGAATFVRNDSAFDYRIYNANIYYLAGFYCAQVVRPYETVIPVPVYGLAAGTYGVSVNGKFRSEFVLAVNNVLP